MIQDCIPRSAMLEFVMGIHDYGDTYKLALYQPGAALGPDTRKYGTAGEVRGEGYTPGGVVLAGYSSKLVDNKACVGWTKDAEWPVATIEAAGALIYNASKAGRAVRVIEFPGVIRSTVGCFCVSLSKVGVELIQLGGK